MKNKQWIRMLILLLMFLVLSGGRASPQPSDAQIRKDVMGPKTVSLTFSSPGKVEWSSTYKKYVWNRNFEAKVKKDEPGVFVTVKGYASYDVMGGRYVFWKTFTTSNSYAGLPNPTAADFQAIIRQFGPERLMDTYSYRQMVGDVESLKLANDPKYEWHTQNSLSFTIVVVFTKKGNGLGAPNEHGAQDFRVRLYRDDPKGPWKNINSTRIGRGPGRNGSD